MFDRIGTCRILAEIGSGGMAIVYKAVQEPLGRTVAVKALKPSIAVDGQFAKRFEREAHFMASLQHENILHVYDFIKDSGSMYIVMEYIRGIDLYDLLEHTPVLPVDVAAIIALQVARALDYAHFRGVVHRDIKPANIMIAHQGLVKLMDFGIARDEMLSGLTESGTGLGTPSYMSPEQILGDKLDFRSDIFSLGIVLYQMITGRKPFVEDDARTVMQKIRLDRVASPRRLNPHVPRRLERILNRCLEKMPANRYPTTQALIDDLSEFLASRIRINHNACVVMYLRDAAVISVEQASEVLSSASLRTARRPVQRQGLLKSTALVQALILLGIITTGTAIQAAGGGLQQPRRRTLQPDAPLALSAGMVRVVANPWAHVSVDGQKVGTTPMAAPIPVLEGKHFFRFDNPFYQTETREVEVHARERALISVDLSPRRSEGSTNSATKRQTP